MNLKVDFIFQTEQRSANFFNAKSIKRMLSIIVPAIVLLVGATTFFKNMSASNRLKALKNNLSSIEKKAAIAHTITKKRAVNAVMLKELNGWKKSRINWVEQLTQLQKEIPNDIELEELRISHVINMLHKKFPARIFTLTITGRAFGKNSESDIEVLAEKMKSAPAFKETIAVVKVEGHAATWPKHGKNDREFSIKCTYKSREF